MKISSQNLSIMMTDIQGYTDASSAASRSEIIELLRNHNRLMMPVIRFYNGTIIKSIGDAFLVTFGSATDAAVCAIVIQLMLQEYNHRQRDEGKQLKLRVVINTGDVSLENNDIFGEAVNVTARMEGLPCFPGGTIGISESTYLLMNRNEIVAELIGPQTLKGIPIPVNVYQIPLGKQKLNQIPTRLLELVEQVVASVATDDHEFEKKLSVLFGPTVNARSPGSPAATETSATSGATPPGQKAQPVPPPPPPAAPGKSGSGRPIPPIPPVPPGKSGPPAAGPTARISPSTPPAGGCPAADSAGMPTHGTETTVGGIPRSEEYAPRSAITPPSDRLSPITPEAGFGQRLKTLFIDLVVLFVLVKVLHLGPKKLFPFTVIYLTLLWNFRGASLGQALYGLTVVNVGGGRPGFFRCLLRAVLFIPSVLFFFLKFFGRQQFFHDLVTNTTVVTEPSPPSPFS